MMHERPTVLARLRRYVDDTLDAGQRLPPFAELTAMLDTSRNSVNNVLRALQAEGVVVHGGRGRGWFKSGGSRSSNVFEIAVEKMDRLLAELRPGDPLPSRKTLVLRWSITERAFHSALDAATHEGLVERRGQGGAIVKAGEPPLTAAESALVWLDVSSPHSTAEVIRAEAMIRERVLALIGIGPGARDLAAAHGDVLWLPPRETFGIAFVPVARSERCVLVSAGERDRALELARDRRDSTSERSVRRPVVVAADAVRAAGAGLLSVHTVKRVSRDWLDESLTPEPGVSEVDDLTVLRLVDAELLVITGGTGRADRDRARAEARRLQRVPDRVRQQLRQTLPATTND